MQSVIVPNPTGRTPHGLNVSIRASQYSIIVRVDGHSVLPPGAFTPMARYAQPPRRGTGFGRRVAGFLLWLGVLVLMVAGGAAGGLYLYGHDFASATAPHSKAMKKAAKRLDYVAPGKPAVALVLGTDHRYVGGKDPGRSARRADRRH